MTLSERLRLTAAVRVSSPQELDTTFEQAIADGCEGLLCKSVGPASGYQAGARGWQWIKLKRDYRTELSDTVDLVVGAFDGRGRRRGTYGALLLAALLAAYDAGSDTFRTVGKCGTGLSDAELAALPARLAPLVRPARPSEVDSRTTADVWFTPAVVREVRSAELSLSPNHTAGWGRLKEDTGLAMRFPRFTGRWREDKGPRDATTADELIDLFHGARR